MCFCFYIIFSIIIFGSIGVIYIISRCWWIALGGEGTNFTLNQLIDQHNIEYGWLLKLIINSFGYSCIFVPGILIYQYTKKTKYLERTGNFLILYIILLFVFYCYIFKKSFRIIIFYPQFLYFIENGFIHSCVKYCMAENDIIDRNNEFSIVNSNSKTQSGSGSAFKDCIRITYCFTGLMGAYLTWGLLQEKIMTQQYENPKGIKMYFKDSQFLVFANRALAFFIAGIYLFFKYHARHRAPIYKYSFASLSNIFSAWFQYEALKFVSFPTQVLAKSCKIIPVMLMGKIISRSKYEFYEYLTAILISIGMICFLTGSANGSHGSSITTMTGVLLLMLYMTFDSFTSNWQGDLFRVYSMSSMQMMCGVNFFSTLLTAASLFLQGGFMDSINFASEVYYCYYHMRFIKIIHILFVRQKLNYIYLQHPKFVVDCTLLSLSSAVGQLFIFYTIHAFGPVVFTIIMTVRQVKLLIF